ncbi:MAG: glycosyltransferase family 1 protein [Bacteroidales bacterium]
MSDLNLHLVSFDVPYPANYGGVIDVFYKAKALSRAGVKVHLHCFEYGRGKAEVLSKICESVHYYKRNTSFLKLFGKRPYIVSSRVNKQLIAELQKDDYPILLEGIHTCSLLECKELNGRKRIVRAHNVEHDYYEQLSRVETDFFKRLFYKREAKKLKTYESVLKKADGILTVKKADNRYFNYKYDNAKLVLSFHPYRRINIREGKGKYALYHGNLSCAENVNAVRFLVNEVFNHIDVPLKIAGLNPSKEIYELVKKNKLIELIPNPTDRVLFNLIQNAQVNVAYSEQPTGLKLKLLNMLHNGRFCLVNDNMLMGNSIDDLCITANDAYTMKREVQNIFSYDFSEEAIQRRRRKLRKAYSLSKGVKQLIRAIS